MHPHSEEVNHFLVNVFHRILKREAAMIGSGAYSGLSLREMHVIQEIVEAESAGESTRSGDIARRLDVTGGTLTSSIQSLERKGFVQRCRDQADRRVVHLAVTAKGREAHQMHMAFHEAMVDSALQELDEREVGALIHALKRLDAYFQKAPEERP